MCIYVAPTISLPPPDNNKLRLSIPLQEIKPKPAARSHLICATAMCTGEPNPTPAAPTPTTPPHVALLSSPGMGHVLPLAELARRLHESHGFTATLLTYASSDSAAQRAFLSSLPPSAVRSATLPRVPLDDLLPSGSAAIETLLSVEAQRSVPALAAVLSDLKSSTNHRLVAFVADLFGADTLRAAREVGVPGYLFFPSNLLMLSLMLHLPRLDAEMAAAGREFRDLAEPVRLPGCVAVPGAEILQPLQDRGSEACRWMVRHGERYRDAAGILVNTFDAAEPGAAAVLREHEHGRPPVYPVGPITTRLVGTEEEDGDDATGCLEWLDEQPERSVLFVSFGSGGALSSAQTRELARGLEVSGARFLWVVRSPTDIGNPGESYYDGTKSVDDPLIHLPVGFVSSTTTTTTTKSAVVGAAGGRWRVVRSWAPQRRVLAHGATMAMVTHCGWNSVLESVASGVPMVAWPLYAEQRQNAVMLCDDEATTGPAVALRPRVRGGDGDDGGLVLAEDIADVVKEMMHGEKGAAARARVAELRDAAASALRPGGLSYETLAGVVSKWKEAAQ